MENNNLKDLLKFAYDCSCEGDLTRSINALTQELNSYDDLLELEEDPTLVEQYTKKFNELRRTQLELKLKRNSIEKMILEFQLNQLNQEN